MPTSKIVPIDFTTNKTQLKENNFQHDININIKYNISLINYNGMICGTMKEVSNTFINTIETELISKHTDCEYYVQGEQDDYMQNDYMPSPFSNSNTIKYIIPNIFYDIITLKINKYIFKIRFFSKTMKFDFLDNKKYPTYVLEINKLN